MKMTRILMMSTAATLAAFAAAGPASAQSKGTIYYMVPTLLD
jgi:ABC-type glycerol-3-phosphate transport system substrate-binding protein